MTRQAASTAITALLMLSTACWARPAQSLFGRPLTQPRRSGQLSRCMVLEDLQPIPSHSTCRLASYTAGPPAFGSSSTAQLCAAGGGSCLQPCASGYTRGTGVCLQKCPDLAAGPHHLCSSSRTCISGDGICPPNAPMLTEVPFSCTAQDAFLPGRCAKQSYQALRAARGMGVDCPDGSGAFKDRAGGWRCAPERQPCAAGFSNGTEAEPMLGAHCKQECPAWLVDCGNACHAPGVPCNLKPLHLCPVVPLKACDTAKRSSTTLQTACQAEGFRGTASCPMALTVHGGCGGQLQVASGLRGRGLVRKIEAWWGSPDAEPQQLSQGGDGQALRAPRLTFTNDQEPVVFGNASATYSEAPQAEFSLESAELIVGMQMWTSISVIDGSFLTPVLAGFSVLTSLNNNRVVGAQSAWAAASEVDPRDPVGAARQHWQQSALLEGDGVGVGLPVGAAAYSSSAGIHAFGLLLLGRVPQTEL